MSERDSYRIKVLETIAFEKRYMSSIAQRLTDVLNTLPDPRAPPVVRKTPFAPLDTQTTVEKLVMDFTSHLSVIQGYFPKELRESSRSIVVGLSLGMRTLPASRDDIKGDILKLLSYEADYSAIKEKKTSWWASISHLGGVGREKQD